MKTETMDEQVPIPCVRNCCLDDDDICVGCFRTLDEILQWRSCTDEEKQAILIRCEQRKKERG
ncbi:MULTISPECIES: DUF1289 domain-containing protein [Vibrio]|uniref:DUF1289 domain-containing protein n=1 Tax=Vibrio TaxID=662 RepID=UPI0009FCBEF9|nr:MULTISPECIES: DUF1289 domain-containing protein [Vibrio]MDA0119702.1 DUF1289 domain-containing protein [Vibrio sp. T11.5]NRB67769.1 DUF1289 domain-containing protein [Vibrio sp.]